MRDKIISGIIGILIGGIIVYGYGYFYSGNGGTGMTNNSYSSSEISDEQITRIATRTGLSETEIKSRLESGETLRDITGSSGTYSKTRNTSN